MISAAGDSPDTSRSDGRWSVGHAFGNARDLVPIAVVVLAFLTAVLTVIGLRTPLGHDESVYMLRGRDIADLGWSATSGNYWVDYRAPGVPILLATMSKVVGLHVTTSRALIAVLAAVMVVMTWAIGRRFAGGAIGVVGAALLAVTTGFLSTATNVLADVPGAAFSIAAVWLFGVEAHGGRLRWALYLVPVLTLMACVSRFGAPFMLGAGFIGVSLMLFPHVVRARNWVLVLQSLILGVVMALVCWLVLFTEFVSIRGQTPVEANSALIEGKQLTASTGFRDLRAVVNPWSDAPIHLWSAPVAVVMLVGVVAAVVGALIGRVPRTFVAGMSAAAVLSTAGIVASVGLIVNNYLALTLPYWTLLAATGLVWSGRSVVAAFDAGLTRAVVIGVAGLAATGFLVDAAVHARNVALSSTSSFRPIRAASVELGKAYDHRCVAVTSYTPQVGYYSRCIVTTFSSDLDLRLDELLSDRLEPFEDRLARGYQPVLFLVDAGKRQPPPEAFDSAAVARTRLFEYSIGEGRRQTAWVQLIEPCVMEQGC